MSWRNRALGSTLALASATLYTAMYVMLRLGVTSPVDFNLARSVLLVVICVPVAAVSGGYASVPRDTGMAVSSPGHFV